MCSHNKNSQLVETKLAGFVEEIVAPPGLVNILISGEVSIKHKKPWYLTLWFYCMIVYFQLSCTLPQFSELWLWSSNAYWDISSIVFTILLLYTLWSQMSVISDTDTVINTLIWPLGEVGRLWNQWFQSSPISWSSQWTDQPISRDLDGE